MMRAMTRAVAKPRRRATRGTSRGRYAYFLTALATSEGEAIVTRRTAVDQKPEELMHLGVGDYFGERALLLDHLEHRLREFHPVLLADLWQLRPRVAVAVEPHADLVLVHGVLLHDAAACCLHHPR